MSKSVKCGICIPYEPKDKDEILALIICPHGNLTVTKCRADDEPRTIAITAEPTKIAITVGDTTAEAGAVVVIAVKTVDAIARRFGVTHETLLTLGFVSQVSPEEFLAALRRAVEMVEADLVTKLRMGRG